MSNIRFRLAKPCDAKQIAYCHWHVRDRYSKGIFLNLGKSFLTTYYKIILNDPWEVVVCAENEDGKIIGFSSGTIDAAAQAECIKKHKLHLGFAALRSIILKPKLLKGVLQRYNFLKGNNNTPHFIHTNGPKGDYWCWLKSDESLLSVEMNKAKGHIMYDLGCKEMFFEVDKFNKQVYKYHIKINKAEPLEEIKLPDGRVRVLFRQSLKQKQ